jgi:hypothetical protein
MSPSSGKGFSTEGIINKEPPLTKSVAALFIQQHSNHTQTPQTPQTPQTLKPLNPSNPLTRPKKG